MGSDPPLHREAWHWIKGLYRAAVDRTPPSARVNLERIMAERVELYSYVPSLGMNTPIYVEPYPVDKSVPTEDDIEWALKILHNHRSGGPSGMRAKHLKMWLAAARKAAKDKTEAGEETTEGKEYTESTDTTEPANWERVVDMVQTAFREGRLTEESMWQAVVLIPKGRKDYRGIGLVEVIWKVVAKILNRRLTTSITFHDFLHGFRAGRGTGTANL